MIKILQFSDLRRAEFILNGGIAGGKKVVNASGKVLGLHNKTLIFATPAGTVTLSDTSGRGLSPKEIADQILAVGALSGLYVGWVDGYINISDPTPAAVVLDKDGTANADFGFGNQADISGLVYNPYDGAAPRLLAGPYARSQMDGYYAVVELP